MDNTVNINDKQIKNGAGKDYRRRHAICLFICSAMLSLALGSLFLLYGPFSFLRDFLVTTAMTTLHHQWIATTLFDSRTIDGVLARNVTLEPEENTDPSRINVIGNTKNGQTIRDNATTLPVRPEDGEHIIDGIGFIRLRGKTYNGWLVKIYDPSRLYMGISSKYGAYGEKISKMAERLGAYIGINAGGFIDINGHGNGGMADAIFIKDGKQLSYCNGHGGIHSIIGLDYGNRLLVGRYSQSQVEQLKLRDAVEWQPLLIVNGIPTKMTGNGGYGVQPRTAIGQTGDGVILFAIIDGRGLTPTTQGATVKDMQQLMLEYGAVNAANLDGGSSTVLVVDGKVVNKPCSHSGERYLPNGFFVNHSPNWKGTVAMGE